MKLKIAFLITNIGWLIGLMVVVIILMRERSEKNKIEIENKELRESFAKCNGERMKVKSIIKGDSLKTLLYW